MLENIREDLVTIWQTCLEVVEEGEFDELTHLSNTTIHNSSIYGDELSISAAVIVYSLHKIAQRRQLNVGQIIEHITKLMQDLSAEKDIEYKKHQKQFFEYIQGVDSRFKLYIDQVLEQAKVKKGWKVYDHGISMGASANLLGVSQWELMNYVGNTVVTGTIKTDVKSRLAYTRRLFF